MLKISILCLLWVFPLFSEVPKVETSPRFERDHQGWILGTVGVHRQGADGRTEDSGYMITDRKLKELKTVYPQDLLNPGVLKGKRVLDIGTGGGSLVTALRSKAMSQCAKAKEFFKTATDAQDKADGFRDEAAKLESEGKRLKRLGEAQIDNPAKADGPEIALGLKRQANQLMEITGIGEFLCQEGDQLCKKAEPYKKQSADWCDFATKNSRVADWYLKQQGLTDAHGIDIALPPHLHGKDYFKNRDFLNSGYPAESFDHMFSSWAIFSYESQNLEMMKKTLEESQRILKMQGTLTVSPVSEKDMPVIKEALKAVPGLKITRGETPPIYSFSSMVRPLDGSPAGRGMAIQFTKVSDERVEGHSPKAMNEKVPNSP